MVLRHLMLKITLPVILGTVLSLPAAAGEWHSYRGYRDFGGYRDSGGYHGHRTHRPETVGYGGLPSIIPGLGTYSGAISAMRVRGNGIYFSVDGGWSADRYRLPPAPRAKIITITAKNSNDACSYEGGVCIIRP